MWKNLVLLFFTFGCWLKYLEWPLGYIAYHIWYVLVATWILLNALGVLTFVFKEDHKVKADFLNAETKDRWLWYSLLSLVSFWFCGEFFTSIAFLLTSGVFMFIVLHQNKDKKKRK